jgi:LruC domain-containing protein
MKTLPRFLSIHSLQWVVLILAAPLLTLVSCNKQEENPQDPSAGKTMEELVVSRNFSWATTRDVSVSVIARDNMDNSLPNVRFDLYTASPDSGGVILSSGVTDASGLWTVTQPLPTWMTRVTLTTNFLGLPNEGSFQIQGNKISTIFGGLVPNPVNLKNSRGILKSPMTGVYYMGTYNRLGVPNYLEPVNDPVTADLLNDMNASVPEQQPVPTYHPQYLANSAPNNIALTELCDVWVTYITEGAGWKNSVGYFSFETDNPPMTANDIDSIMIVFPNLSNVGANSSSTGYSGGGGLNPGNKVYLGRFPAGKTIGWVIFANGWNGSQVTTGNYMIFSLPSLNPEPNVSLKRHTILLRDAGRREIWFGFEDKRRDQGADQDFNDGIMIVKASPVTAINTDGMPGITTTQPDGDGDGVPDVFDDYPTDPTRAFDNWYPSKTGLGTLAFEDLWPGKGDYDFNDLVISYRFNQITNGSNKVVEVQAKLITEAMGASLHNAFGFQMQVPPSDIASVSGTSVIHGWISLAANNTETGQSKAVVIAYDDAYDRIPPPGIGVGTNTEPTAPYVTPDTMNINIMMTTPVSLADIGTPPYNPFIIVGGNRDMEVHLPDKPPTDKAGSAYFGTYDDDSQPAGGRYYKTKSNLPWAINIAEKFDYVIERVPVNEGYLKFNDWAESAGASYPDWYKDLGGYRDDTKIYTH